jgi:hypothetical protein
MAIFKNKNNKCWWGCDETGAPVHCWCECKSAQPLWKTVWRVPSFLFLTYFFHMRLGCELRASCLQNKCFTAWATIPVHFALIIMVMGSCELFSPGWPWNLILPISTFQVARLTAMRHWCRLFYYLRLKFRLLVLDHSSFLMYSFFFFCFWFWFLMILGLELRTLYLLGQCFTTWVILPAHFL